MRNETLYPIKQRKILNDAFYAWFGDSKVVDANGDPRVVYHGTRENITAFDPSKSRFSGGMYFSSSKEFAKRWAGPNGQVYAVYLKIENPLLDGFDGSGVGSHMSPSPWRDGGVFTKRQTDHYGEKGIKEYIVFSPNQIKSIDNNGTWDPLSDNIFE